LSFPETQFHLLSAPQEKSINSPTPGGHPQQEQGYLFPAPDSFPEKAKKIGLARFDLLNVWKKHRKGRKKEDADREFIDIYNNNIFYKNLHDTLGSVSIKTLYRWEGKLAGTTDWRRLVPLNYEKWKCEGLNEAEKKAFLGILLNPKKFRIGTAIIMTKIYLKKKGIISDKSDRTYRRYAERYKAEHYDIWVLARQGQKALKDKVAPFNRRDLSMLEVGDVLVADGHRLNFQTINSFTGKPIRAVLVGYLDWKSYDLAGYEIMLEENTQCIASALRNSIIRLGKIPKVTYQDNGKAFLARYFTSVESFEEVGFYGLFGRLGITPVFANPYNARSKPIERWFREFTNTFERLVPSFVGSSIGDKPAWMLQGEKFHKILHREYIPTIEETIQMIEIWLEWQRSRPCPHLEGKTIGQVFNEGRGPGIDINQLDYLMMAMDIKRIGRNGIRFLHSDYCDGSLYGLRENVLIRYCLSDLSHIKVYRMNGQFLCIAKRLPLLHPMANHLGTSKDMEDLKQRLSEQRRLEKKTTQGVRGLMRMGRPIELGWEKVIDATPRIINKLEKENITPSGRINEILADRYSSLNEAMKEFFNYVSDTGTFFSQEDRRLIEETIISQGLNRNFVQNFALEVRSQLARREAIPLESKNNPEGHSPIFQYGWQRYEFLSNKQSLTEGEKKWIEDYKEGRILPGEYEEVYIKSKQQSLDKRETL
jgi:putative transposase